MPEHNSPRAAVTLVAFFAILLVGFFLWRGVAGLARGFEESRAAREAELRKREEARSQVQVIGRQWDGTNEAALKDFQDPWGNRILVSTLPGGSLEVRSLGPDGLPYNSVDVCARFHTQSASHRLLRKPAEFLLEGATKGVRKGIKGKLEAE